MDLYTRKYATAVIVCHDFIYGPPHELRDYMILHGNKELLFIGHVNRYVANNSLKQSYCEHWKNGRCTDKYLAIQHNFPELFSYLIDCYYALYWSMAKLKKIDVFIGVGNLNAFVGLLLKILNKTNLSVYYVIDYASVRFKNRLLNYVYHLLDSICANKSDSTWNYSGSMINNRNSKWKRIFPNQIVVPNGIRIRIDIIVPLEKCNRHEILYMGTLTGYQGVDTVIQALPGVKRVYPDAIFTVIGDGKDMVRLKMLVKQLKLTQAVYFLGFIENPREMESRIAQASIGVACYDTNHPLIYTTEPGKVKRYLACGIPVVMTDVSPISKDIRNRCGFIVSTDVHELVNVINSYFGNEKLMIKYRQQSIQYAKHFQWEALFKRAFESFEK